MEMSDQLRDPAAFPLGRVPHHLLNRRLLKLLDALEKRKISCSLWESNQEFSVVYPTA
jgi:hypothetical protein